MTPWERHVETALRTLDYGILSSEKLLSGRSDDPIRDVFYIAGIVRRLLILWERAGYPQANRWRLK
jgi:hypothetical protein